MNHVSKDMKVMNLKNHHFLIKCTAHEAIVKILYNEYEDKNEKFINL